jgi:AmmeMemoRadiSam system protein B
MRCLSIVRRKPIGAGLLYPSGRSELLNALEAIYREARAYCRRFYTNKRKAIKAVLVPHGVINVSGPIALAGLGCLVREAFDTVVVVGANHSGLGLPVAAYPEGSWVTPISETRVDYEFSKYLVEVDEFLEFDEEAHKDEYSVETVLILLQYLFGTSFRFVPIVVSDTTVKVARSLADSINRVAEHLGRKVLLIATTNFGVEPDKTRLRQAFDHILQLLLSMKVEEFYARLDVLNITLCNPAVAVLPVLYAKLLQGRRGVLVSKKIDKSCLIEGYTGYASLIWI